MIKRNSSSLKNFDWPLAMMVILLVVFGWVNISSATSDGDIVDFINVNGKAGKQLMWAGASLVVALLVINIESEFFIRTAVLQYTMTTLLLVAVLIVGKEVGGAKSWFSFGSVGIQPSEFAKPTTALILAWYLSQGSFRWKNIISRFIAIALIALPAGLVLLQPDAGTVIVFSGFVFMLYREGLSGNVLIIGFSSLILSVATIIIGVTQYDYPWLGLWSGLGLFWIIWMILGGFIVFIIRDITVPRRRKHVTRWGVMALFAGLIFSGGLHLGMEKVLQKHQKERIHVLFGIDVENPDADYNIQRSKAAIGSGGVTGKGWGEGPMTSYKHVPEQETDFIFCTVGEEWGFIGSATVILLFLALLLRIIFIAERQRSDFTRIYGYGVASVLFMHFLVNIGMVLGLAPVIGIPLPFFSYGGSALLGFTFMISILLRLDAERLKVLR